MVWWVGRRPLIALPARLIGELDDQQTSMVLAHELAHLRRRDHWVRGAELVISVLYWWNPMVAWVRRQLHEAEELCSDAWVEPGPGWSVSSQVATTDERGECVIRNLPSGNINLRVTYGDSYADTNAVVGDGTAPRIIHLKPIAPQPPATPPAKAATPEVHSRSAVGQLAPPLSVQNWTDGKTRSLTDFAGQVVVLDFWGYTTANPAS